MRTRGPGVKPLGVVSARGEGRALRDLGLWSESRDQSPYTAFLIRRDPVKMAKALRAEINDVVVKYTERKLRKDGTLDVAVMAHEMTQSLVDMIMDQDEHDHAPLLALMILSLGGEYLQRTGIGERRDN